MTYLIILLIIFTVIVLYKFRDVYESIDEIEKKTNKVYSEIFIKEENNLSTCFSLFYYEEEVNIINKLVKENKELNDFKNSILEKFNLELQYNSEKHEEAKYVLVEKPKKLKK